MREENNSMVVTPEGIKNLLSNLQDGEMLTIEIDPVKPDTGKLRREEVNGQIGNRHNGWGSI